MTYVKADGTILNKTEMLALTTEESTTVLREVTEDIFQKFTQDGGAFEGATKLLFHDGQLVPESEINALFATATVTSISPASGTTTGGTVVTISGTNLAGVEGVTFGGTAGTALQRISSTQIKITTPAKAAAAYNVVVQDDAGDVTVTSGYTYA
jgi:hypothetical protein